MAFGVGILMIILGVFAIGAPVVAATIAFQVMLGWLLVIGGIAEAIHAFMAQNWRGFLFEPVERGLVSGGRRAAAVQSAARGGLR